MSRECQQCGKEDLEEYVWASDPTRKDWRSASYCVPCGVKLWPAPVYFRFHAGIPDAIRATLESFEVLKHVQAWFRGSPPFPIHVYHRRESERLPFQMLYNSRRGKQTPDEPYSYRGWCSGMEIVLLWDDTETPESLLWILYHELGHHVCNEQARMFDEAVAQENTNEGRTYYEWKDDAGHEADSEERLVNRMATAFMGGKEYARPWWRPRVTAFLAGLPMPDPHRPPVVDEGEGPE